MYNVQPRICPLAPGWPGTLIPSDYAPHPKVSGYFQRADPGSRCLLGLASSSGRAPSTWVAQRRPRAGESRQPLNLVQMFKQPLLG